MWARINDGAVAEITDLDPEGRFHPTIPWVECSSDTQAGWHYDGEQFLPPPPEPLDELVLRKLSDLEQALSSALAAGMPYVMPDDAEDVVQTRPEDESNLLGLAIEARDLRDAGETGAVLQLRTLSNSVYELTPQQMIDLTNAAKLFKKQQLAKSWALKDQVRDILGDEALTNDEKRAAIEGVTW